MSQNERKLAGAVRKLRSSEATILQCLQRAEALVQGLAAEGAHRACGFSTVEDLRSRLFGAGEMLRGLAAFADGLGMFHATPSPADVDLENMAESIGRMTTLYVMDEGESPRAVSTGADPEALERLAAAFARARRIEEDMRQAAADARAVLGEIDRERLYTECGYGSYEEFLELALGSRPFIGWSLAILGEAAVEPRMPRNQKGRRAEADAEQGPDEAAMASADAPMEEPPPPEAPSEGGTVFGVEAPPADALAPVADAPIEPVPSVPPAVAERAGVGRYALRAAVYMLASLLAAAAGSLMGMRGEAGAQAVPGETCPCASASAPAPAPSAVPDKDKTEKPAPAATQKKNTAASDERTVAEVLEVARQLKKLPPGESPSVEPSLETAPPASSARPRPANHAGLPANPDDDENPYN